MAQLDLYSTPASRALGQSFGDRFISSAKVALNGGNLYGGAVADFGLICDSDVGATRARYETGPGPFDSDTLTFEVDFTAAFVRGGDSKLRTLLDIDQSGNRLLVLIRDTGAMTLITPGGNTSLLSVLNGKWLDNARNVLTMSFSSTRGIGWLNGEEILNSTGVKTNGIPQGPLTVGSYNVGSFPWDGVIKSIAFYKGFELTQQDNQNSYNHTTYNYRNKAIGDWPMLDAQHGGSYGANVLLNSDFEGGFTAGLADDWAKYQTVDITYSEAAGRLGGSCQRMVSNAASIIHAGVRQAIATVAGIKNKFGFWVRTDDVAGGPTIEVSNSDFSLTTLSVSAGVWTYFEFEFTPTSTASTIYFQHNSLSLNSYVEYDDTWAIQGAPETLDVSRSKKNAVFGVGSEPTKVTGQRGYSTGGSDYMVADVGQFTANGFTAIVAFSLAEPVDNASIMAIENSTQTEFAANFILIKSNSTIRFGGPFSGEYAVLENIGYGQIYIAVGVVSGTDVYAWNNGAEGTKNTGTFTPTINANTKNIYFVRGNLITAPCGAGSIIHQSLIIPFALTPLQVQDITGKIMRSINAV